MEKQDLAAFMGLYIFQGARCVTGDKRAVTLSPTCNSDVGFIRGVLAGLPFDFFENRIGAAVLNWECVDNSLYDALEEVHSDPRLRRVPGWIKEGERATVYAFCTSLPKNPNYPCFYVHKEVLARDLKEVFEKAGFQSRIVKRDLSLGRESRVFYEVYKHGGTNEITGEC